jgi:hypothetical protein
MWEDVEVANGIFVVAVLIFKNLGHPLLMQLL